MKLEIAFSSLAFTRLVAGAAINSRRGLAVSAEEFASRDFDHLIVGGGLTGIVAAARLSEDPNVSVGVIEAGEYFENDPLIDTPGSAPQLPGNAKYDWLLKTVPQDHLYNRSVDLPRGKALGGSTAINRMVFDRASKLEYDAWALLGNQGFHFDELVPYMKAAEHFTGADPFRVNDTEADPKSIFPSQGTNGPIEGSYNTWYGDLTVPYRKTLVNAGIPINYDPDSGTRSGIYNSAVAVNRTTGKRSYAANTYYAYNAHRTNFVVLTGAQVTKILLSDAGNGWHTATGVSFVHSSAKFEVKAKKTVILAAGSLKTAPLLELSGIGNPAILKKFGITPLINLTGVGENYQDHIYVSTTYELKPGSSSQNFDRLRSDPAFAAAAKAQYDSTHDGPFSYASSCIGFVGLDHLASQTEIANMIAQFDREIAQETLTVLQKQQYAIQKEYINKVGHVEVIFVPGYAGSGSPKTNTSYVSFLIALEHPFSRGDLHIDTADALASPRINPKYLSKSIDQTALVQAIKFSLKLSKTEPLASLIVARQDPAPEITSDDGILDYIKKTALTIHHPIGTAAMAPYLHNGVVDSNFNVYGTHNLLVIDASVVPLHIGTHLSRTMYGIAEKAASSIKSRYH